MAQEIELKLALPVRLAPRLRQLQPLQSLATQKRCIRNIYLDTPEQSLRQQKIALRRRQIGSQWLLTIKTASSSRQGLSRRLEWEYPQPPDQLDFSPVEDGAIRQQLEQLAPGLKLAFRTDFVRQTWELRQGNSSVELALDLGYIRSSHARTSIHEIELELLKGEEDALAELSAKLQRQLPLVPLDLSKAARGYALLDAGKTMR
ncbi:inorganic triphosphatase [Azovibrio restrictus]|uniref:CYTH domain-containing protein n=1 Tax=Azovibrio restrictus TaxID=146938 RepID=UPI0026EA71E8|nr:CYTH domain-containing protein [Azovibrio restrictus]MDD3483048.1 CYTH domain-containing protein [Azovibrio restrictus]